MSSVKSSFSKSVDDSTSTNEVIKKLCMSCSKDSRESNRICNKCNDCSETSEKDTCNKVYKLPGKRYDPGTTTFTSVITPLNDLQPNIQVAKVRSNLICVVKTKQ